MSGYHDLPDAAAEAIDSDGWFHTAISVNLDAEGYLRITDRKKDMFKTSQGKYAPGNCGPRSKACSPVASDLIVHGESPSRSVWHS